ncbi:hypothetical protein GCM10010320_75300 [Streptomyces caelestis]|uniref:Uncharacterized protein n=1 Tax=Streptomyces caelestis TaxID=36816 RepID=A0A7W9HDD0_9ACTN|nr:hypothetical protein [Streptomyces caelestis]GGW82340.1 hypothetical protein GCM10010320_75300 [Streptomyces caelestis]
MERFGARGGDWGTAITRELGRAQLPGAQQATGCARSSRCGTAALCPERICRGQRNGLWASSEVKSGVDGTSAAGPRPFCHDEENR